MLEIAGDFRLENEPRSLVFTPGELRLNLLHGHIALKFAVARQPDLADSSPGMLANQLEALAPDARRMRVHEPRSRTGCVAPSRGSVVVAP